MQDVDRDEPLAADHAGEQSVRIGQRALGDDVAENTPVRWLVDELQQLDRRFGAILADDPDEFEDVAQRRARVRLVQRANDVNQPRRVDQRLQQCLTDPRTGPAGGLDRSETQDQAGRVRELMLTDDRIEQLGE